MFRCEFCGICADKSECESNPLDDCSLVCWECLNTYEENKSARCWETSIDWNEVYLDITKAAIMAKLNGVCPQSIINQRSRER